jgi:hypothetical protein
MNRLRIDIVLRSGVRICSPDVSAACSPQPRYATYCHEPFS